MKTGDASKNGKGRKLVRIRDRNSFDTSNEEVTETFQMSYDRGG